MMWQTWYILDWPLLLTLNPNGLINCNVLYLSSTLFFLISLTFQRACDICVFTDQDAEVDDELYEVVDITDYARRHQWWSRVFGNNSGPIAEKYSVATQIMMGGVTGWCVMPGYFTEHRDYNLRLFIASYDISYALSLTTNSKQRTNSKVLCHSCSRPKSYGCLYISDLWCVWPYNIFLENSNLSFFFSFKVCRISFSKSGEDCCHCCWWWIFTFAGKMKMVENVNSGLCI